MGAPFNQLEPQEVAPDPAGLEPSLEGAAQPATPQTLQYETPKKKSWVDHPVTVGAILTLAMPSVMEQVISVAIGLTDTIVAGHTGDSDAYRAASAAAVGTMTYLQWFAGLMTAALGTGASAIVARSIGSKDPDTANKTAGTVCSAAFLIGIAVAAFFFIAARPLVWIFGLTGDAANLGVQYLQIMCWTVCFQTAGQIGMACLRGAGDTMRPMLVTAAIALVNGFASPALTFGWFGLPAMGVRGNATGTLLSFVVAGVVTFAFLFHGDAGLQLRLRYLKIVPTLLARVAKIGLPSWFEGMLLWTGQALIVMLVMRQVDKAVGVDGVTMAAHNATLRIESLAFLPGFGFGIACASLVGQYLGAKKPEQAMRAGVLCNRFAFTTMTLAAIPMVFAARYMLHFMVDSKPVVDLGVIPLIIAGLAQPGFAIAIIKSSALKGAGETVSPLYATLLGMGGRVVVVLALIFALVHYHMAQYGLIAVWICIFLDLNFRAVFLEIVFHRGEWKKQRV